MSKTALGEYNTARQEQLTRNDARRIRARVDEAQQNPDAAGLRWPFELMQNAHDAGPRNDAEFIEVVFRLQEDGMNVSHTGKPFSVQELAALLSGGSSKEFDDLETTGRFGTGFLATHALSTRVDVEGIVETREGHEQFTIPLDREGDEGSISENIEQADNSVSEATPVSSLTGIPTASFIYRNANDSVVERGIERLRSALPYLFGTCRKLGSVSIETPDEDICFARRETFVDQRDGFTIETIEVGITDSVGERKVNMVRISEKNTDSALLALNCMDGGQLGFVAPPERFPRLFLQFPISETGSLPFNVIIDGKFTPKQERDGIAMNDGDRQLIESALSTLPVLVEYAVEKAWENIHRLVRIAVPKRPLGGENAGDETDWWKVTIQKVAEEIARKPIVRTPAGWLPAVSEDGRDAVSFLVPSVCKDDEVSVAFERIHEVVSAITDLHVPSMEVISDWEQVSREWEGMGAAVDRLAFKEVTDWIKERAEPADAIPVTEDPFEWLAELFLLGAEMNDDRVAGMINGLLPNQNCKFCDTGSEYLYEDAGIPDEIKMIAERVEVDLRSELLHDSMATSLNAPGFEPARTLVWELLDKRDKNDGYDEAAALQEVIDALEKGLPIEHAFDEDSDISRLEASARLVQYLWESNKVEFLRKCPLLTSEDKIVRLTGSQQILAPIEHWPASAKPYAGLYTKRRVLSDRYCGCDAISDALDPLIVAGLALAAPLYQAVRPEIEDRNLLSAMLMPGRSLEAGRVTVREESFGQIAFLSTDLVRRCGQDVELAKLLLDFVLSVAAREDNSWREIKEVEGHRSGDVIPLSLHGATWPFELKVRSWVPVWIPDEERLQAMPANEPNLRDVLDHVWLRSNQDAVELLHRVFGFSELTLMIESLDSEENEKYLVALLHRPESLKIAAQNPEAVEFASELDSSGVQLGSLREIVQDLRDDEELLDHLEERREQKRRVRENQDLGGHVEELVRRSLECSGFSVRRTGTGSDFEISVDDVMNLEVTLDSRTWLVEVKSTRDQRVRMTGTQARYAVETGDGYLLCVVPVDAKVPLPGLDDVKTAMRFVQNVGSRLEQLCDHLAEFENRRSEITSDVSEGVQLEIAASTVRVRVDGSVWENDGFPLDELAGRLMEIPDGDET